MKIKRTDGADAGNDKRLMEVVNAVNKTGGEAARADIKNKEQGA